MVSFSASLIVSEQLHPTMGDDYMFEYLHMEIVKEFSQSTEKGNTGSLVSRNKLNLTSLFSVGLFQILCQRFSTRSYSFLTVHTIVQSHFCGAEYFAIWV